MQAMGWYYYLEEKLRIPFAAICCGKRAISPLCAKDEVDVIGMAQEEEREKEIFVADHGQGRTVNLFWRRIGNESRVFDRQIRLSPITCRVVLVLSPPRTVLVIVIERLKETSHQKSITITITSTSTNNRK